jgi:putative transposase
LNPPSTPPSPTGNDNALCESFFATLECELFDRERFRTPAEACRALFDYIDVVQLAARHSALDYP